MEFYSAIKRNEVPKHAATWMNLEDIFAQWKKPDPKGNILYDLIYIKYPE